MSPLDAVLLAFLLHAPPPTATFSATSAPHEQALELWVNGVKVMPSPNAVTVPLARPPTLDRVELRDLRAGAPRPRQLTLARFIAGRSYLARQNACSLFDVTDTAVTEVRRSIVFAVHPASHGALELEAGGQTVRLGPGQRAPTAVAVEQGAMCLRSPTRLTAKRPEPADDDRPPLTQADFLFLDHEQLLATFRATPTPHLELSLVPDQQRAPLAKEDDASADAGAPAPGLRRPRAAPPRLAPPPRPPAAGPPRGSPR